MSAFESAWALVKMPFFETESAEYQQDQAPTMHAYPAWNMDASMSGIWDGHLSDYISDYYNDNEARDETISALKAMHMDPFATVRIYRAIPDDLEGGSGINPGDWVALSEAYARLHGDDYLRGNYSIEEMDVNAHDLFTHGDSIHEFGWVGHRNRDDPDVQSLVREHYRDDLSKQYTPDWRVQARKLPYVGISYTEFDDGTDDAPHLHYPIGHTRMGGSEQAAHRIGGGSFMNTFRHPADDRFVMKVPITNASDGWHPRANENIGGRIGTTNDRGQGLVEILESLGFPVVSEMDVGGEYTVMPRLEPGIDGTEGNNKPDYTTTNAVLRHILGDRDRSNYGIDSIGNWRMYDTDMQWAKTAYDWWPNAKEGKTTGERLQDDYYRLGIELPASKILNILDMGDYQHDGMRALMEAIEPYSENPRFVTVDGRPVWREGYDSL